MQLVFEYETMKRIITASLYNKAHDKIQETTKITVEDYEKNINNNRIVLGNTILPAAVRYLDLSRGIVLFERPPCYVPFNFSGAAQQNLIADKASVVRLNLPIPWQRYVLFLAQNGMPAKIFVFFDNEPIQSLYEDRLCYAPLPNLYDDCSICLPQYDHIEFESLDLISAISAAYDTVWKSGFNLDVTKALMNWQAKTSPELNPLVKPAYQSNPELLYRAWSRYSLEEVVSFNWKTTVYLSFNYLVENSYSSEELHDRVVDIFLASRS